MILTILKLYNEARFFGYVADNSEEMEPDRIRPAILILPGGGYAMTSDREAEPVENTLMLIQACRAAGVSIEAHLFPEGSHGLSLANAERWQRLLCAHRRMRAVLA